MGYSCFVVTVDEKYASYPSRDISLQKDVEPTISVNKTRSFEILKVFSSLFKKEKVPYAGIPDKEKMSFIGRLALFIRSNFFIPDARVGWNAYALNACREIIDREKIEILITTSPPHSTQLIGLALKKKYKSLKWIADLRDPWTDIYYYPKLSHTKWAKKRDLNLEMEVLKESDLVTVTSPITEQVYASKLEFALRSKVKTITNGFDEEDFAHLVSGRTDVFTITFAGTINEQFGIEAFVQVIKKIVTLHSDVLLHFVGTMDVYTRELLKKEIPKHHRVTEYIPHHDMLVQLMQSQVLFMSIPKGNNEGTIPGKLFEYLATHKNILCLGPTGCSAGLIIEECASGKTCLHEESSQMEAYLLDLIKRFKAGEQLDILSNAYLKYTRKNLAKQYADFIEVL